MQNKYTQTHMPCFYFIGPVRASPQRPLKCVINFNIFVLWLDFVIPRVGSIVWIERVVVWVCVAVGRRCRCVFWIFHVANAARSQCEFGRCMSYDANWSPDDSVIGNKKVIWNRKWRLRACLCGTTNEDGTKKVFAACVRVCVWYSFVIRLSMPRLSRAWNSLIYLFSN